MPPDRPSARCTFDLNMVDPEALNASDGFHIALRAVEGVFHRGDSETARVISALMENSHILEYIISGALYAFYALARYQHRTDRLVSQW